MFWGEHGPHSLNVPFFMAMEGLEEVVATAGYLRWEISSFKFAWHQALKAPKMGENG